MFHYAVRVYVAMLLIIVLLCLLDYSVQEPSNMACTEIWSDYQNLLSKVRLSEIAIGDCCDAIILGNRTGAYWFKQVGKARVFCDMDTTAGEGWIVFARRNKSVGEQGSGNRFNKNWKKYVKGFGLLTREFWFGLENLHYLTSLPGGAELLIEFNNGQYWARYSNFSVGNNYTDYELHISGFTSNLPGDSFFLHNGAKFSTSDHTSVLCRSYREHANASLKCCSHHIYNGPGWWLPARPYQRSKVCSYFHPFVRYIYWTYVSAEDKKELQQNTEPTFTDDQADFKGVYGLRMVELKLRIKRRPCPVN